jgi:hypothetical protein
VSGYVRRLKCSIINNKKTLGAPLPYLLSLRNQCGSQPCRAFHPSEQCGTRSKLWKHTGPCISLRLIREREEVSRIMHQRLR